MLYIVSEFSKTPTMPINQMEDILGIFLDY